MRKSGVQDDFENTMYVWRWSSKSMIKSPPLIVLKNYGLEPRDDDETNKTIRSFFNIYVDLGSNLVRGSQDFRISISKILMDYPFPSNCFYFRSPGGHFRRQL